MDPLNPPSEALVDSVNPGDDVPEGITVAELLADPALELSVEVLAGSAGLDRRIRNARVQKSGLALVGHFHGLESWRIQILGATEISFLESLDTEARTRACEGFAGLRPCAVVVTRGVVPLPELAAACEQTETPLLITDLKSSLTINAIHGLLDERLAPRTRIHGVLVSVFGLGVLLLGRSGIGKSECALDLVMRGHRLVADDVVECAQVRVPTVNGPVQKQIIGTPAVLLEHHIEIRGLGILNVKDLFGVTSVAERIAIDLVVKLSDAADGIGGLDFDRLGVDEKHHTILGVDISEVTIPVRPGRDIAAIMQIAARNELLKRAGHHGARAFRDKLEQALLSDNGQSRPSASGFSKGEKP
jgi:HPr kinase/phosphorylase